MATADQQQHESSQPALVDLFDVDLTVLGGPIYYFTNDNAAVTYNSQSYTSLPVKIDGAEHKTADTAAPTPTLTVANVDKMIQGVVQAYNDLIGCKVTRTRVFADNPDGGNLVKDSYLIDQKTSHNKFAIEFRLITALDNKQRKLPRRQVLKNEFPGVGSTRILL